MDTNKLNIDNANNTNEKLKFDNLYSNTHKLLVDSSSYDTLPIVHLIGYSSVTAYSINLQGIVSSTGGSDIIQRGFVWGTSPDPIVTTNEYIIYEGSEPETFPFYGTPNNLQKNTTYYFRAWAINSIGIAYSNNKVITTLNVTGTIPLIYTYDAKDIGYDVATLYAFLEDPGGVTPATCGWSWAYHNNAITWSDPSTTYGLANAHDFFGKEVSVWPNSRVRFRAWAINSVGIHYAEDIKEFVTGTPGGLPTYPTVLTIDVSNISTNSAIGTGNVTSTGNASPVYRGFTWATHVNPVPYPQYGSPSDPSVLDEVTTGTGIFDVSLLNLEPSTRYYARAFAYNSMGIYMSTNFEFYTLPIATTYPPTVRVLYITNVTTTSFDIVGEVMASGNVTPVYRGFCYSGLHSGVSISDTSTQLGTGLGAFSTTISNLSSGVTYYVNAYAYNSVGVSYGVETFVKTQAGDPVSKPIVTTNIFVNNITTTSADVAGNVTHDGSIMITKKGITWSTDQNDIPYIRYKKESMFSGEGPYTINLTGLNPNTLYYYAAYAYNYMGTSFGNTYSFTTLDTSKYAPIVTTTGSSNVQQRSMDISGEVTSDGNDPLTRRGICYRSSTIPTVSDSSVTDLTTGKGPFVCTLTGLNDGVLYRCRAFAYNSKGIAYGETLAVNTLVGDPPYVVDINYVYGPTSQMSGCTTLNLPNATTGDIFVGIISTQCPYLRRFNHIYSRSNHGAFNYITYRYKRMCTTLFWAKAVNANNKITFQTVNWWRNEPRSERCLCHAYVLRGSHLLDGYNKIERYEGYVNGSVLGQFPPGEISVFGYYPIPSISNISTISRHYICLSFLITDSAVATHHITRTAEVYPPETFSRKNNCNYMFGDNFYYQGEIHTFSSTCFFSGTSIDFSNRYWAVGLDPIHGLTDTEPSRYQVINWAIG